jgi:hypothetical protein
LRRLVPSALALALAAGSLAGARPLAATDGLDKVLPFVADDYAKALSEARAQKLPLFIEAWAPW